MERAVRMRIIKGMLAAFMTFSRIPVVGVRIDKEDMKYSMCFLPVIGIIIGLIQWLADAAFTWLGAVTLGVGIGIGFLGSILALRKHTNV